MAVVAIAGDDLVTFLHRHLHAHHHGLLADIEVAEAADEAHAVELAGLLFEAADQEHVAIGADVLVLAELDGSGRRILLERLLDLARAGNRRVAAAAVPCFFSAAISTPIP